MLSAPDVSGIVDLVQLLENASDQDAFFDLLVKGAERLLNISSAVLIPFDSTVRSFRLEGHRVFRTSSELVAEFVTHYHPMDPFILSGWSLRQDATVAVYEDSFPASELEGSEFVIDFLSRVPMRFCLGMVFRSQGDLMGIIGLHRERSLGNFGARKREIAEVLWKPVTSILHRRAFLSGPEFLSDPEFGVLVVGTDETVLYANPVAKRATEELPGTLSGLGLGMLPTYIHSRGGRYRVRNFPVRTNSTTFFESRIAGSSKAGSSREVRVLLFEPVSSSPGVLDRLEKSGLTPRQRNVVSKVIQGYSNREIAEVLSISEQTVKDHLHDIFEKLRIRNRCELVVYFTNSRSGAFA